MGRLDDRVAIVTGAGRGLGRAHALFLASEGAHVVVNDLGGDVHGGGADKSAAQQVVDEITAAGGHATVSGHDVADWQQAGEMIQTAIDTYGDLHVLVNNAGILRDKTLANMTEDEWDAVIRVHLKGHAAPSHHAMAYWRAQSKAGQPVNASVVHTSSLSGLLGNFGQANYGAVKIAVLALSRVVGIEGAKIGVRSNAVSPGGRTRLAKAVPGGEDMYPDPEPGAFDPLDPACVSPLIGWLAAADCPANMQVFHITGDNCMVWSMPHLHHNLSAGGRRWTLEDFDKHLPDRLVKPMEFEDLTKVELV